MKFKNKSIVVPWDPDTMKGLKKVDELHTIFFGREAILTSGAEGYPGDGVHMQNSLHYKGMAFDVRISEAGDGLDFLNKVRKALPAEFQILPFNVHFELDRKNK